MQEVTSPESMIECRAGIALDAQYLSIVDENAPRRGSVSRTAKGESKTQSRTQSEAQSGASFG
jgi:hypothetical protein